MRKLIGKIIVWFLKGQTLNFENGYVELPDYVNKKKEDVKKPLGRFKIK